MWRQNSKPDFLSPNLLCSSHHSTFVLFGVNSKGRALWIGQSASTHREKASLTGFPRGWDADAFSVIVDGRYGDFVFRIGKQSLQKDIVLAPRHHDLCRKAEGRGLSKTSVPTGHQEQDRGHVQTIRSKMCLESAGKKAKASMQKHFSLKFPLVTLSI